MGQIGMTGCPSAAPSTADRRPGSVDRDKYVVVAAARPREAEEFEEC